MEKNIEYVQTILASKCIYRLKKISTTLVTFIRVLQGMLYFLDENQLALFVRSNIFVNQINCL